MSKNNVFWIDNDMILEIDQLHDQDGNFINSATITATIKDADDENVTGPTWPLSITYVENSDGKYRGILQDTCELTDGVEYYIHIDSVANGIDNHWEFPIIAKTRTR